MDFQIDNVKFDFINEEEKGLDFLSTNSTMSFSTNNFEMQIEKMTPSLAFETTGVGSGTNENDHTKLINRDAENQHPISAITGLQKALDNVKLPDNIITEEEFDVVKEEFGKALEEKLDTLVFENAVNDVLGKLEKKANQDEVQEVVNYLYEEMQTKQPQGDYALKSELPDVSNLITEAEFNTVVNEFGTIVNNLQPKGDYVEVDEVVDYITVSETDNLTKENNMLKAFTEAGKGAITTQYARLLNLPQGDWKSLLTDTGVLILYKGSVSYRTTDGVNFQQVYLPSSPTAMAKNYETNIIYGATPSSAGMWMYSKDDGLTWTYTSETSLSGYSWDNVVARNNGSKKTGWNSSFAFTRSNSTTKNFASFSSSGNRFEMNNNSKKRIDYTVGLNYDYWCANTSGEVFKTSGSSTFTFYENTKNGLTCIKNCNNNIFCGFNDGTIAECMGYKQAWNFYTVASGEKVTDIVYKDGVYYVVTDNSNYYTSTDLTNWTKFNGVNSYGGVLEFTRFGIVQVTEKPVLIPSRRRIENSLLDLHDLTNYSKVCGGGLKYENGQIQLDITADIPIRLSQGRLNLFNIDKYYFSDEVKTALIASIFSIDFCPADDYDTWLWEDYETGYWYGEVWAGKSVLWICTADGYIYDPIGHVWELYPAKYDVIRIVYDEWGNSCTGEIIGNLEPLKNLFNS